MWSRSQGDVILIEKYDVLEQIQLACFGDCLGAIIHPELAIDILHVGAYGVQTDDQLIRDLLIFQAISD